MTADQIAAIVVSAAVRLGRHGRCVIGDLWHQQDIKHENDLYERGCSHALPISQCPDCGAGPMAEAAGTDGD